MKSRVGVVLEGGGARGAYHLGVYKALMEMEYKVSGIAGTSIGALNGALIAQGDWKRAYSLWFNISNKAVYNVEEEVINSIFKGDLKSENLEYAADLIGGVIKRRGIDTGPMKELFGSILNERRLRKSHIDLGIVTVKLSDFSLLELFKEQIPRGEMLTYLMASANFPLFQREGDFIDGGVRNNLPLNMLPLKGIKNLIAVRTNAIGYSPKYENPDVKVSYISPESSLGPLLDFNRDKARENLLLGYHDAWRQLEGYLGKHFCIKPVNDDFSYINQILTTGDDRVLKAAKAMGYNKINPKRFMFERLLPQISDYLGLGIDATYEEIIIMFFEEIAREIGVDNTPLYSAMDFISKVREEFVLKHGNSKSFARLPKLLFSSSFLSAFIKNDFFHFIMDIFFN